MHTQSNTKYKVHRRNCTYEPVNERFQEKEFSDLFVYIKRGRQATEFIIVKYV